MANGTSIRQRPTSCEACPIRDFGKATGGTAFPKFLDVFRGMTVKKFAEQDCCEKKLSMSEKLALVKEGRGVCQDLANLAAFRANPRHLLSIDTLH